MMTGMTLPPAGRRPSPGALLGLLLGLLLVLPAAARADEKLHYRWRVEGFFGALSALFFPSRGEATLAMTTLADGNLQSSLVITSQEDQDASFFRYEAEIDRESGRTLVARSSQLWRGKRKDKSSPIVDVGAVDIASAIEFLRRELPDRPQEMEIWSDGRLYPVRVVPAGPATRQVGDRSVPTLHYSIRPLTRPDRRVWKGELDLWFARDPQATPVEMLVARPPARLRLELVEAR
jgi:hypothetical protein